MATVRFFYDVVCPYAFMASTRIDALAAEAGAEVEWVPVLLGGLFRHTGGPQVPAARMSPPRARLNLLDIQRQAERHGLPLRIPAEHPRRTVSAMRLILGAPEAKRRALSADLFRAYWIDGRDVADRDVLAEIAAAHQVDDAVIDDPAVKQALFDTTRQAADAGAFGVPTIELDGRIWWGADRLHLVAEALGLPRRRSPAPPVGSPRVTFFHDFSSPFSYLGSTQIERVSREAGAELEWAPILLGGLFREIGTADVPMLTYSAAKQRYALQDLHDWARWWGVPFRFPSNFPLRTVLPLRVALAEPAATPAIYRAAWAEDRNIGDPAALAEVLTEAGFDAAALLARTQDPGIKAALMANGKRAEQAGACGVPSFLVDGALLIWGQDRIDLLEDALRGWRPQREASSAR